MVNCMDALFWEKTILFGRFLLAFVVIFSIIPRFIFSRRQESSIDNAVSNYVIMTMFLIILGYILAAIKLFEVLGISIVILIYAVYHFYRKKKNEDFLTSFNIRMYDLLENKEKVSKVLNENLSDKRKKALNAWKKLRRPPNLLTMLILISVIGGAAYLRFYDAWTTSAPAMSDAYVTLAWMKYINQRYIFHDGIYPQGFHIILASIYKFSAIDPLHVLKFTGPFNGLLTTGAMGYFVYRITEKTSPALLAAFIYGIMGGSFFDDWMRQASTNSQEFAFIFVFPALFFFARFVFEGKIEDLIPALAATCAAGLSHTLGFGYIGLGMALVGLAGLLTGFRKRWRRVLTIALAGIIACLISILPAAIGLLLGSQFHGSSAEYLVAQSSITYIPALKNLDYAALAGLLIIVITLPFRREKSRAYDLLILFFASFTFVLYRCGGVWTQSTFVASRADDLWTLALPISIGFGMNSLAYLLPPLKKRCVGIFFVMAIFVFILVNDKPIIPKPYKMEHESGVAQYLRISKEFTPTTWLIVSQEEGYAIVLGKGWHLMLQDFLTWYDPSTPKLFRKDGDPEEFLDNEDIFIYEEKELFRAEFESLQEIYERRESEYLKLKDWLYEYQKYHDNISVYYEDDVLRIWHIHQEKKAEEEKRRVWGEEQ